MAQAVFYFGVRRLIPARGANFRLSGEYSALRRPPITDGRFDAQGLLRQFSKEARR